MKRLLLLILSIYMSVSMTACTTASDDETSLPSVDIVSRSELLDMVNTDHIIDRQDRQLLADMGVTVKMTDFELTADNMAGFTLHFTTKQGANYQYATEAVIDYIALNDGGFDNIRFYWGDITQCGDKLLITFLDRAVLMPLENTPEASVLFDLSFVKENDGYIVHTATDFDRYAFMYYTPAEAGLAVFDGSGKLISHITDPVKGEYIVGMFGTHTAELVSDVPFSYEDKFGGEFVSRNLFMIDLDFSYPAYHLYNCRENSMSDTVTQSADSITVNDTEYSVYTIYRDNAGDKTTGYGGLALRRKNGRYTGAVLFDTQGYSYEKDSYGTLSVTDSGSLVYHSQPTGLQITVDFENSTSDKKYTITDDMLGDKIASSDVNYYSLYEYGKNPHNNTYISYLALKNEKTGDISYVADYKGAPYRDFSLEAGFFSNGDIYLMTDYDFEIFTTDSVQTGPVFRLSDNFKLGELKEDGYRYNTLCAVRRNPDNDTFIVVYDHLSQVKYYGMTSTADSTLFDDTYQVALLDSEGNLTETFITEMPVPASVCPLNMYLNGNVLTLQNVDKSTGEVLQKATLNIKTGKFTQIEKWTAPQ